MKALIFNSGLGSRMGEYCKNRPKGLLPLYNGETILERQIRILSEAGIKDYIITTGPFAEQIEGVTHKFPKLHFVLVENPKYNETNYIVSMNLAAEYLKDDILLLHGDLVFNRGIVRRILSDSRKSLGLYHETKELPEKDFKGRFVGGVLKEVSVSIFGEGCFAFQPFYKLEKSYLDVWLNKVKEYVEKGEVKVYAENALNDVTDNITIEGLSWSGEFVEEIDNEDDYKKVSENIKMFDYREQKIIETDSYLDTLKQVVAEKNMAGIFVVCSQRLEDELSKLCENITIFTGYSANPKWEEILTGIELFQKTQCHLLVAVGGGSALDTAKCIKMASVMENPEDILKGEYAYSSIPIIAVPTTAGTGSESTEIAVFYQDGKKYALQHGSLVPDVAILDADLLTTLPLEQKKATLLDALGQGIESYWAAGATKESREYAKKCIRLIMEHQEAYITKGKNLKEIMLAANFSGRAINLSKTTAAHAMSYKLTSLYGIPHGQAVGLCLVPIWKIMAKKIVEASTKGKKRVFDMNSEKNLEKRTEVMEELEMRLREIADFLGADSIANSIAKIEEMIHKLDLPVYQMNQNDIEELVDAVDPGRMGNHPIPMTREEIKSVYLSILA